MKMLEGKIALVTGASRGIGKAIAERFREEGATVFTVSRKAIEGNDTHFGADVADYDRAVEIAKEIEQRCGRLDILVNNAGMAKDALLVRTNPQDWNMVLQNNLTSVFNYTKAFASMMMKQRSGSIVNISSVVGLLGNAGQGSYAASKAGIIGFSRSITKELGSRNIRCNVIAPGFIQTEMTDVLPEKAQEMWKSQIPMGHFGSTEDVANTALYLASDLAKYITGQVICCDGGLSL